MNTLQDNNNKQDKNTVILGTYQNIEYFDIQDGMLYLGFLIISKDSTSFSFRWSPYKSNRKLFSFETENPNQLINSNNLYRVFIETSYQHCEVSFYCVEHDEPTVFRTTEDNLNFSHQLAQLFTIYSVFLNNPNWIYLTHMFIAPPTQESGSVIYYIPCYKGKFSFPVFLTENFVQKIKENIEKVNKNKEIENDAQKKSMNQAVQASSNTNIEASSKMEQIKSFFNFSKFSNNSSTMSKPPQLTVPTENSSFLSNFSQIISKYKIKNIATSLPMTQSDCLLFISQKVPISEVKKRAVYQGMDIELRRRLWPVFLSVIPNEKNDKVLLSRVKEYENLKLQWNSLSSFQLAQMDELRSAFYTIEIDVKRTIIPDDLLYYLQKKDETSIEKATSFFRKMLKNILKTFAVWNNNIRYTQGINEIAVPFVCVALYDILNEMVNLDESEITFFNKSEVIDINESNFSEKVECRESIAFWSFVSFQEKSQNVLLETSMVNLIEIDLPEILEIVKKQNRDAFKFLKQYQLDDLNFLVSPFMLLFRRSFSEKNVERLWDTIISIDDLNLAKNSANVSGLVRRKNFEYAFAASVVIFLVQLLKKRVAGWSEEAAAEVMLIEIPEMIKNLPIELVLRVALFIESDLPTKTQPRIATGCLEETENEFFTPSLIDETKDYASLNLFC